ncbi:MAG: hypothetical protein COA36_11800 [Desulfotalea sp.]|nr:MAG: hypothetical protein COA36_11800 [Desulfotalea sp.]
MKNKIIDPCPVPLVGGGADFKDEFCADICYRLSKEGISVSSCTFLQSVPSWPMDEFLCTMPDDG